MIDSHRLIFYDDFHERTSKSFVIRLQSLIVLTDTESSILALDKSWITKAIIATVRVYASSICADSFFLTFVSIFARVGLGISGLTIGTLAGK